MSTTATEEEQVAAGAFAVFMLMVAGPAGIVIAAMAVGLERMFNRGGRSGGSRTGGSGWSGHASRVRAAVATDRAYVRGWRDARRKWFRAGGNPDQKPRRRGRFGQWARRAWLAVIASAAAVQRFTGGARAGARAANQRRRDGGTFREIAGARPEPTDPESPASGAEPPAKLAQDRPTSTTPTETSADLDAPATPAAGTTGAVPADLATTETGTTTHQQEEPMSTDTAAPQAAGGETNLDLTAADLTLMQSQLAAITEITDALAAQRGQLDDTIDRVSARAAASGGTTATLVALDAARAVSTQLRDHLSGFSDAATEAGDVTSAAEAGLTPARDAQDSLHAAGATGEFVSAAAE